MEEFNWNGKKVFVTGAGGFIGSHLTEKLVELGAQVRALVYYNSMGHWEWLEYSHVKRDLEVFSGDIRDRDSVNKAVKGQEIVFHLAALIGIPYSYQAPLSYEQTNILGTLNVLNAALEQKVERFIHTSTSEVYGTAQYVPIDEKHPLQAQSPYSATKIGADMLVESYYKSFNLSTVTIRPFNTYGPRQSARAIIPAIITQILKNNKVVIGNTEPTRDLSFVEDVVSGFVLAASIEKKVLGQVFNLGFGKEISIQHLVELVMKLMSKNVKILSTDERKRPKNSEVNRLLSNSTKAYEILGWKPQVTLQEGLQKTIEWFGHSQNLYMYKSNCYHV